MADKISEKLALEVWELGVPLSNAPDAFGATKALARIRRQARLAARANTEMGKANFRKAGANADAILDALEPAIATLNASAGTRIAKEDRLFERLRTGELIALGFPVHDADTATPVQMPIFMFDRRFSKWKDQAFVGLNRHYANVSICAETPESLTVATSTKPMGAPSFDQSLELIVAQLASRNISLTLRPRKLLYAQMRSLGIELTLPRFDEKHPDDETIRRFLSKRAATEPVLKTQ